MITITYFLLLAVKLSVSGADAELVNKYHTAKECQAQMEAHRREIVESTDADQLQCVKINVKVTPKE